DVAGGGHEQVVGDTRRVVVGDRQVRIGTTADRAARRLHAALEDHAVAVGDRLARVDAGRRRLGAFAALARLVRRRAGVRRARYQQAAAEIDRGAVVIACAAERIEQLAVGYRRSDDRRGLGRGVDQGPALVGVPVDV